MNHLKTQSIFRRFLKQLYTTNKHFHCLLMIYKLSSGVHIWKIGFGKSDRNSILLMNKRAVFTT